MKVYINEDDNRGEFYSSVELLCSKKQLDVFIDLLTGFREEVERYYSEHEVEGLEHFHYQDNNPLWSDDESDIVIYVDMTR